MFSTSRITESDVLNSQFYQMPKFLFEDEYKGKLNNDAIVLYSLLRDRHSLSLDNGWKNERNEVFFIYSREQMKNMLRCSYNTAKKALDQLRAVGLIEEERVGKNKMNRLYLMKVNHSGSTNNGSSKSEHPNFGSSESETPRLSESETPRPSESETPFITNKTDINKTDSSNTEREQLRRRSRKYEAGDMHEKKKDEVDDNPKMTSQVQERIRWLSQDDDVIPLTPREKKMFDLFILERKRRGKTTSRVQRNTMIQNLHLYGHDEYVRLEILEKTIAKGWNDIYPLDRGAPGATNQEEGNSYGNGSI